MVSREHFLPLPVHMRHGGLGSCWSPRVSGGSRRRWTRISFNSLKYLVLHCCIWNHFREFYSVNKIKRISLQNNVMIIFHSFNNQLHNLLKTHLLDKGYNFSWQHVVRKFNLDYGYSALRTVSWR